MAFAADKKPKPSSGSTARKAAVNTEADPRLPLVLSMLQPESVASKPKPETQAELAAAQLRTEQFLRKKILRNDALLHDLHVKWQLQKEAIRALPAELREAALQPDLRPFPPARNYFFDTPPEAYRD